MPRRSPYTKVEKENQIRANHVRGMGDVVFKGFQCINSECTNFIFVRKDEIYDHFEIECPNCGKLMTGGDESKFYDYRLIQNEQVIEQGEFTIFHEDYIAEAQEFKYCIVCNTMKPLRFFDTHNSRQSRVQGECRLCKKAYNSIKNQTRTSDQHREAAQKRRLYLDLAGGAKINSEEVFTRYDYKCFKCGKDLRNETDPKERPLDHTLPAVFLWPLTTETATLLCREHNAEKAGKWTSEYYSDTEIRRLSLITGLSYDLLSGERSYNPDSIESLKDSGRVEELLLKFSANMDEIIKLRNRILRDIGFDFFSIAETISDAWVRNADREFQKIIYNRANREQDIDET